MRKFLDRLYLWSGYLGALFIVGICVAMIGQSILRELGVRTGAVNDVVSWFCAAAAFFAMPHAFKHGDFVRVTLLLDSVSDAWRKRLELIALCVASVAVSYLAWWACKFTYESWEFNDVAQGLLAIPMWIPQMSFAIGSVLLLVAVLDELVLVLLGHTPTYVREVQERHARGDFSSDV
jgi:TRAP-type C4-dicarboxylate transport system permease small subunit